MVLVGLIFHGVDLSDYGWRVLNYELAMLPPQRTITDSALYRDGSYDFSSYNPDGRVHYDDRPLVVEADVVTTSTSAIEDAVDKLAQLMVKGWGELILPTMPDTVWIAHIDQDGGAIERDLKSVGIANIPFRMRPFSIHKAQSETGIKWNECDFAWQDAGNLCWDNNQMYTYNVSGTQSAEVTNFGNMPSRPIITVEGTFSGFTVSSEGKSIGFSGTAKSQTVILDFGLQTIVSNGQSIQSTGEFWEFASGSNTVSMQVAGGSAEVVITIPFQYIYKAVL